MNFKNKEHYKIVVTKELESLMVHDGFEIINIVIIPDKKVLTTN
jgi:hypothetical protein